MPHAVWPRAPGRDWAGVVVAGLPALIGQEMWGSGGELGIRRDGSQTGICCWMQRPWCRSPST